MEDHLDQAPYLTFWSLRWELSLLMVGNEPSRLTPTTSLTCECEWNRGFSQYFSTCTYFSAMFDDCDSMGLLSQSQRIRDHSGSMRSKLIFPTQTIMPKTHPRTSSHTVTSGNRGTTDHHAFIGTQISPNLARSQLQTPLHPKRRLLPSSGGARRNGPAAHQSERRMTAEKLEMNRVFPLPLCLISHI